MTLRAGVIGVGAMGMGMARSLQRAGFDVHALDVDEARVRMARESGLFVAGSPRELAAAVDVAIIVVVDATQIEQVLTGEQGLLAGLSAGDAVLFCSTIAPDDTLRFAAMVQATGAGVLDAPISGGPARAENATMSMMLAGQAALLQRLDALLQAMSAKRFVISDQPGDAAKAKLVNNLMAGINLVAGAEAMALARKLGLDERQMFELIRVSSGQSWMFEDRVGRALEEDYAPRAQAHVITKDLTLANQAAASRGLNLPLGEVARAMMKATCDGGWRTEDDAAVLKFYRRHFGA